MGWLSERHDDDGIIRIANLVGALARPAAARPLEYHGDEKPRLDSSLGANPAAQHQIVALEKTARRIQPLRLIGEPISDGAIVGIDDAERLEDAVIDVRH
jgi:hypothetical protein